MGNSGTESEFPQYKKFALRPRITRGLRPRILGKLLIFNAEYDIVWKVLLL